MKKRYKRRNRNRNKKMYIVIGTLVIFILVSATSYALLSEKLSLAGIGQIEYSGSKNVKADIDFGNKWSHEGLYYYNVQMTFTNIKDETLDDWVLCMNSENGFDISTTAEVHRDFGQTCLTPYSWNKVLEPNGNLSLNMIVGTIDYDFDFKYVTFNDEVVYGVKDDSQIELSEIIVDSDYYEMETGSTLTLNAYKRERTSSGDFIWSSSNPDVATVSKRGVVSAKKAGTTIITVSCQNVSKQIKIKVNKKVNNANESVSVEYKTTNYWYGTAQFEIKVKNTCDVELKRQGFRLEFPEGTNYNIWTGNVLADKNVITSYNTLKSGETIIIYGQAMIPNGYKIEDYVYATVTNIFGS